MEANQVDAEAAQPFRRFARRRASGEVSSESEVDAVEAGALVIVRVRREIGADCEEVAVANEDPAGGRQRVIEKAEVGRAGQIVLVEAELIEGLRGKSRSRRAPGGM